MEFDKRRKPMTPKQLDVISKAKELLSYDPETGTFTWLKNRGRGKVGDIAGSKLPSKSGEYWCIDLAKRHYKAHRLAWLFYYGEWPEGDIDHIDGNGLNNKINNLRECTAAQNSQNKAALSKRNKTGYTGVNICNHTGKFYVSIKANKKNHYLGRFDTAEEAFAARQKAKSELQPFCAR